MEINTHVYYVGGNLRPYPTGSAETSRSIAKLALATI